MEKNNKIEETKKKLFAKKKKKFKFFLTLICVVLIVFFSFFIKKQVLEFLHTNPQFYIKKIEIYPKEISHKIENTIDLESEKNLLFINGKDLRQRILNFLEIEDCSIIKKFPNTLEIYLKLRKPWAILNWENKNYIIDKKGIILSEDTYYETPFYFVYGVEIEIEGKCVRNIQKLNILLEIEKWYNYFNVGNHFKLRKIDLTNLNHIILSDGVREIYLTSENIKEKFEKLSLILRKIKDYEYIDLRFKDAYVKIRKNEKSNNSN